LTVNDHQQKTHGINRQTDRPVACRLKVNTGTAKFMHYVNQQTASITCLR